MSTDAQATPSGGGDAPYIPASTSLPEITIKAVILGVLLSIVLASANTYLGLFAGMTVSASIPAAVISMAILRLFRNSNILENNIVQTSASAGESLAAGVIFTIPALVIMGAWKGYTGWNWLQITIICGLGGLLGVLFTIPLRRALIVENPLRFPEGVATAEVLKVGDKGGGGIRYILIGGAIGALFKFGASALKLWGEVFEGARQLGGSLGYFGTNLSPALIGVGYIVGLNIAILVFVGGAINWLVAIPIFAGTMEWPVYVAEATGAWNSIATDDPAAIGTAVGAQDYAWTIWSKQTRYLGVGAMAVGGLWALIKLRKSLVNGIKSGIAAYKASKQKDAVAIPRTEQDTPMNFVAIAFFASAIPLGGLFLYFLKSGGTPWGASILVAAFMAVAMLIAGFLFSSVAGYMAGLVGSSNNPISGVTIATILTTALLLFALTKMGIGLVAGGAAAILIGAVVCCACAIGGDNMQDLKAGKIVGATPYKQQIMQAIGVVAAAGFMAPVLWALDDAYGIGVPTEEHPSPLTAPQATLMASVARGVFALGDVNAEQLPWGMVAAGAVIAVAIIVLDLTLEARGSEFRTPVLAVAVGIYLPLELSVPIFIGGVIAWVAKKAFKRGGADDAKVKEAEETGAREGLLFSSGLITGEALLGILIAFLIIAQKQFGFPDLAFGTELPGWLTTGLGVSLLIVVIVALWWVATNAARKLSGGSG